MMKKVLVVVDMQKKFIEECRADGIVPCVVRKIGQRRAEGFEILFTSDDSGGDFEESIAALAAGCGIYRKNSYGSKRLILDLAEKNPETVEVVGVCTDICVITNVLAIMAFLPFSEIIVDGNCCASSKTGHSAALRVMRSCNVNVI